MKLARFTHNNATRIGVVVDDSIVDLGAVPELPRDMVAFLSAGKDALERARTAVRDKVRSLPLKEVTLEAPVARPPEFLAIGLNYADHVAESGMKQPEFPMFFNKQATCVNAPFASDSPSARFGSTRLRRRTRHRDRQTLSPCAARPRP